MGRGQERKERVCITLAVQQAERRIVVSKCEAHVSDNPEKNR